MEKKLLQQLSLWSNCDLVDPAISAEQYQLQHAHPISVKNPPGGPPEAKQALESPVYRSIERNLDYLESVIKKLSTKLP